VTSKFGSSAGVNSTLIHIDINRAPIKFVKLQSNHKSSISNEYYGLIIQKEVSKTLPRRVRYG